MNQAIPIAAGCLLAGTLAAHASFFRLELRPGSRVMAERVAVRATMINRGDEDMHSLQAKVWFNGAWYPGPQYPALAVGETLKDDIDVGALPPLPGTYTAVVAARYTDRNGHPFSTIETIPVHTLEPRDRHPFEATLKPIKLKQSGVLALTMTSLTNVPVQATVHMVLPDELQGQATPDKRLTLAANEPTTITFPLRNAWAVPGSQYRIYALIDYSADGLHGSRVVAGGVTLTTRHALTAIDIRRLWIIPGALLALFGIAQFWKSRGSVPTS